MDNMRNNGSYGTFSSIGDTKNIGIAPDIGRADNSEPLGIEELSDELKRLQLENKKLKREIRHISKDNELLRLANEQTTNVQNFIQKENLRQIYLNKQLLKTSPYLLILVDENLRMVMISDIFYRYCPEITSSYQSGVGIREVLKNIVDEYNLDIFMERCNDALQLKEVDSYIIRCIVNGDFADFQISIRPMTRDDKVIGLNIVFVDMTEMIDARDKAEAADKAKSSFLANMSHEIRTPINAVLGMDEMILRESRESTTLSYARDIQAAGKTLLSLINEILDLSKIEEGKMEIVPVQYDIGFMISDLKNMVFERANDKGLSLNLAFDNRIPALLYGDEVRLRQCILNLLVNAIKYTEEGYVDLGINYRKKDQDSIYLEVSVSDTGIGMKKEDMAKLFSPFYRIEEDKTRKVEGTGLGMSITSNLLELMGSKLCVESVYGKGSVFSFVVIQKVVGWEAIGDLEEHYKNRKAETESEGELFRAPDVKVLIVDDTPMNLVVAKELLKRTKVQTDEAESGAECLKKLQEKEYDIILLDYRMPEMDGIETLKRIRALADNPNRLIPVIALTANAISGARERFLNEGFDDYISKPIEGERLEKLLLAHLPQEKITVSRNQVYQKKEEDQQEAASSSAASAAPASSEVKEEDLPFMDTEAGIKNCGTEDVYRSVLQIFIEDIPNKTAAVRKALEDGDIKRYTVEVHSLKSSARIAGALKLSAAAFSLEKAGDAQDLDTINARTEEVLAMYASLEGFDLDAFRSGKWQPGGQEQDQAGQQEDEAEEGREVFTADMWRDALNTLKEFASLMDYDNAALVFGYIEGYSVPREYKDRLNKLKNLTTALKWDQVSALIDESLEVI